MSHLRMTRRIVAASVVALLVASLSACASEGFEAGSTMEAARDSGSLRIGIKHDQPLFGELDSSGTPQGFDVEIARIIADELDVKESGITWVEATSEDREQLLQEGDVDLVVATYTISSERKDQVGFAGPYYVAGQSLLTRKDDVDIASVRDLSDKRVCSVEGSTAAETIATLAPDASLALFDDYSDCLEPLRTGQVDVVTTDDVILAGYADQSNGQFRIVGAPFTAEPYGVGVARENTAFRMWINNVLEEAMEDGRWEEAWESTAGHVLPAPQRPIIDRYEVADAS